MIVIIDGYYQIHNVVECSVNNNKTVQLAFNTPEEVNKVAQVLCEDDIRFDYLPGMPYFDYVEYHSISFRDDLPEEHYHYVEEPDYVNPPEEDEYEEFEEPDYPEDSEEFEEPAEVEEERRLLDEYQKYQEREQEHFNEEIRRLDETLDQYLH